jgi:ATP/maltotriose-dependent transcriptional regulator MalT
MMGYLYEANDLLGALLAVTSERTPERARALATFGWLPFLLGEAPPRETALAEAVQLSQELGLPRLVSLSLMGKARALLARGDVVGATRLQEQALCVAQRAGDGLGTWVALWGQADIVHARGDAEQATVLLEEALGTVRGLGDDWGASRVEAALARVAIIRGDYQRAEALCQERLRSAPRGVDQRSLVAVLEALAWAASAQGQLERATRLLSAADAARERSGWSLYLTDRDEHERALAAARRLGRATFDALWAEARAMSPDTVVEYALAAEQQREPDAKAALPGGLSQRELEVLRLVAAGRSNREIAGELVLSVRTVERHITNLYAKIDARGKADATAYVFRHGLT